MKTSINIGISVLLIVLASVKMKAQKFYDSSIFYSIEKQRGENNKSFKESFKIYVNEKGFQPYLYKKENSHAKKGQAYSLYSHENNIYLTFDDGYDLVDKIYFSLNTSEQIDIYTEENLPMTCFFFGEKSQFLGEENVLINKERIEVYKFKLLSENNVVGYVYLTKDNLLPLKYIFLNEKEEKVTVLIDRMSGNTFNGKVAVDFIEDSNESVALR